MARDKENEARQLQKEIVKRLLYSAKPEDLPQSRFNRIRPRNALREFGGSFAVIAVFVALATLWILALPGVALPWVRELASEPLRLITISLLPVAALTAVGVGARRWLSATRLQQVGLGPATVTLSKAEAMYFDEYLDEILYFFERTKTDVVIFEDLDRFDNASIFRSLRDLNTLVNASPSVQQDVVFIYAVRDSLFEVGAGSTEPNDAMTSSARYGVDLAASERAKFFDLIVPMVPFITHEGSSALFLDALKSLPDRLQPNRDLVETIGRAFSDMRVLLSLKTEYVVFSRVLLEDRDHDIPLDHNQLLSVLAYKHVALDDFERIRIGQSKLDVLADTIRRQADSRLRRIEEEIAQLVDEVAEQATEDVKLAAAGEKFGRLVAAQNFSAMRGGQEPVVHVAGRLYAPEHFITAGFWSEVVAADGRVELRAPAAPGRGHQILGTMDLPEVAELLGFHGPVETWLAPDAEGHERRVSGLEKQRRELMNARLSERVSDPRHGGQGASGENVDMVASAEQILGDGLTLELVRAGYIDHNFTLYASRYYSAFRSAHVTSYMLQVIDRRRTNFDFGLTGSEVRELLQRAGPSFLESSSGLNISIFDVLLGGKDIAPALVGLGRRRLDPEGEFIESYLVRGLSPDPLVQALAGTRDDILLLIARTRRLTVERKLQLLDTAMARLSPDVDYQTGPELRRMLEQHVGGLTQALQIDNRDSAASLAEVLTASEVCVPSLRDTSPAVREALVHSWTFDLTLANIGVITGESGRVGLDSIRSSEPSVFDYVLDNLETYVDTVEEANRSSIDDAEELAAVLSQLGDADGNLVERLCNLVPEEACVSSLADVPENAWRALIQTRRMMPSAGNLASYFGQVGCLDNTVSEYLGQVGGITSDGADEQDRRRLAKAIACASSLDVDTRVSLIRSLSIGGGLGPDELQQADGVLIARLISEGLVADIVEVANAFARRDWTDREQVLAKIDLDQHFDQIEWREGDMVRLVDSAVVALPGKLAALKRASTGVADVGAELADKIAQLAEEAGTGLSADVFRGLISAGIDPNRTVHLLGALGSELHDEEILGLLRTLDGDFALLAVADGKRPSFRRSRGLERLLGRLEEMGLVSSFGVGEGDDEEVRVNKRRSTE